MAIAPDATNPSPRAIHPFLFALFPIVSLYAHNMGRVSIREAIVPTILVLAMTTCFWAALGRWMRNRRIAAIMSSLVLFLFFSFGHLYRIVRSATFWPFPPECVAAGCMLLFVVGIVLIWRFRRLENSLTVIINRVSLVLIVIPMVEGATFLPRTRPSVDAMVGRDHVSIGDGARPDIYYIVLDGYGRADTLSRLYGVDNEPFLGELERRGFRIVRNARANYMQTYLSLASSLNYRYLDDVGAGAGEDSDDRTRLGDMICRSAVLSALQEGGYTFVSFSSGYAATEIWNADVYLSPTFALSEFQNMLLSATPLPVLFGLLPQDIQYAAHRRRINYVFDTVSRLGSVPSPKFVFSHVLAPHPPFVFGPGGESVAPPRPYSLSDGSMFMSEGTAEEYVRGYRDQLQYVNARVLRAVDEILAQAGPSPVIVLQGDHGPGSKLNWSGPDRSDLVERFGIFLAVRLPADARHRLYDEMTPVNLFRIVFGSLFDADLEPLPDRCYFSTFGKPYRFTDVTSETESQH